MIALLFLCCLGGLVSSAPQSLYNVDETEALFQDFINTYNKQYSDEEMQVRLEIFRQNLVVINERNSRSNTSAHGITQFCDLTLEEFRRHTGLLVSKDPTPCTRVSTEFLYLRNVSDEQFDWRDLQKVTSVKNQGNCGSCWTFATTGNIEGQYAIKNNELMELSEQQLVDCDTSCHGCKGGMASNAMLYVMQAGGIESEEDYSYTGVDGQCQFDNSKVKVQVSGCNQYQPASEDELMQILKSVGPLAIGVDASQWQTYHGDIMPDCQAGPPGHAVLLVGYGTEKGTPYWVIKNSWGTTFGRDGYIYIQRNMNACNILASITSATVA